MADHPPRRRPGAGGLPVPRRARGSGHSASTPPWSSSGGRCGH